MREGEAIQHKSKNVWKCLGLFFLLVFDNFNDHQLILKYILVQLVFKAVRRRRKSMSKCRSEVIAAIVHGAATAQSQ